MRRSAVFQFRSGASFFHRLDPLSKFAWLVGISLLAFGAYIAWVQIVITGIVLFTALVLARLSPVEIWRGTWLFVIACTSFLVIQTLTLPGTHVAFRIAGHPIYAESFDYALASALRIYTIILSSLVFVRTTDPRELAIALVTQMKVPYRIAYAFFIALRIIPTIEDEIKTIGAAQAVRGVARQGGIAGRIREMKRYSMPLLVGSLRKASMMVMSMEARAFGAFPKRTFVEPPRMTASGVVVRTVTIAAVVAWYAALATGLVHTMYVLAPA
ncbi:energy-coupling factor transporter transmembrane component T family protein [Lichenifustis flavocetrariae]|uniref:Energy-coupling factor transporter transmembrane protein EcfT n=1 Tax=Lichenifustis flavocetrariae TaxID=2949735 RepID=A0AA41Z7D6_9HYPH|nr:energy-coupling factor transporter transmembrane component T [Lichenifustis flavocetrariae]MCW6510617.1 energy-coupling factor transporter transmembrane protein EcfT [Lichenifustis flavocetrariae]